MENWGWTDGRSVDEIADYMTYALRILHNVGMPCEGITTPGGFGVNALPELAQTFSENVSVFDRVWYGLHEINAELLQHFRSNVERIRAC